MRRPFNSLTFRVVAADTFTLATAGALIGAVLYRSVRHAVYVRTKFYRIDSGTEEWLDYPRIMRMLNSAGYNGCLSIVYEGQSDPLTAIEKATKYLRTLL